jgi:hypothetical protein
MHVILWIGAGLLGLLIVVVTVLAARRDPAPDKDLGSISGSWLNEHNATHRDGKS